MKTHFLTRWTFANALGLGVGFVAYMQTSMLFDYGFDRSLHWQTEILPTNTNLALGILTVPTMLFLAGAIFGYTQASVLKSYQIKMGTWILRTVLGFLLLAAVIMPLEAASIMGNIPGPVEPIIFTVGSCSLAGVLQYFLLRRRSGLAQKWLVRWIIGLVLSIIPTILMFLTLQRLFHLSIGWPLELFLNGMMCAGFAAWFSGRVLLKVLSAKASTSIAPTLR